MFAIRVKPYKAAEFAKEGCAEGKVWVKSKDSCFYWSEAERGVWATRDEASKHVREPWEYVVDIELPEKREADEELRRIRELLPDNLSPSKDYSPSSRPSSRVEWLLGRLESNADEIKRLEEGMDRLLQVMAAEKQKRYDVKEPNFRDGKGNLFLVRCPACRKENYGPNVSSGQCSWCGWEDGDAVAEVDSPPVA